MKTWLSTEPDYDSMRKRLERREGNSIAGILDKKLKRAVRYNSDPCNDSYRVCNVKDQIGLKAFENARSCCGSYEKEIKIEDQKYLIGFNYGH